MNGGVYYLLHLVAPSLISVTAHLTLLTFASERSLEAQLRIIYLQFARVKSEKNGKVENSRSSAALSWTLIGLNGISVIVLAICKECFAASLMNTVTFINEEPAKRHFWAVFSSSFLDY